MNGMVKPITVGRMGNFLFQAAAAMGYAWRHGMEFTLPSTTHDTKDNPIYLQHLVKKGYEASLPFAMIEEKSHAYQVLPFQENWRRGNIILDGYWQTEKYFKEFRSRIIEAFGFPWYPLPRYVSVHIRRGDYLTLVKKHPPVPKEWVEKAMSRFPNHLFKFFSDDMSWVRDAYGHLKNVVFSDGNSEVNDLIDMSCCEHHICSASTYSWWGAWLNQNPNKRIIIPSRWFMPGRPEDTSDIIPPEWEKV